MVVRLHLGADYAAQVVRVDAEYLLSTADPGALVAAFGDEAIATAPDAANFRRYRDFLAVALVLGREDFTPTMRSACAHPVCGKDCVQIVDNRSAEHVPMPGRICLAWSPSALRTLPLWRDRRGSHPAKSRQTPTTTRSST